MLEEIDYSEESKCDLFESSKMTEKLDWAKCILCQMAPSIEDLNKKLKDKNIKINKNQYAKMCKDLGFKFYN